MIDMAALPVWIAVLVGLLLVAGAGVTLVGSFGLVRLSSFYQRLHAPTLGTSLGGALILLASSLFFTIGEGRPVLHEILILGFIVITTPVTLMLLARAGLYRDRAEGNDGVPVSPPRNGNG
jgi:multicomponent K+:H+ antiporter subunit G